MYDDFTPRFSTNRWGLTVHRGILHPLYHNTHSFVRDSALAGEMRVYDDDADDQWQEWMVSGRSVTGADETPPERPTTSHSSDWTTGVKMKYRCEEKKRL